MYNSSNVRPRPPPPQIPVWAYPPNRFNRPSGGPNRFIKISSRPRHTTPRGRIRPRPARPTTSVNIDLSSIWQDEDWRDDPPARHSQSVITLRPTLSTSQILKPKKSSSGSGVPCFSLSNDRYFIQADQLPRDIIKHLTRSISDCSEWGDRVHLPKVFYPKVAGLLLSSNPPISTYLFGEDIQPQPEQVPVLSRTIPLVHPSPVGVSDRTNNVDDWGDEIQPPSVGVTDRNGSDNLDDWGDDDDPVCPSTPNVTATAANVHGPSLPNPKLNPQSLQETTTALSSQETAYEIPGFEILKHLVSPSTLTKTFSGNFYKTFDLVLPRSDATRFYGTQNAQKIILRLIQSERNDSAGESFQESGNSMFIESIGFNGQSPSFQKKTKGHFNVDVTRYLKGGASTTVEISTGINGCKPNDSVVYSISIVRILTTQEMLKDLRAKLPIPVNLTKKLVIGSLTEAAKNGILTSDLKLSVSLKCPLGKKQMKTPCRGVHCDHFLCFDAQNFLQTYENVKISKWTCPVCDSHLDYEDLIVDSFFDVIVSWIGEDSKDFNVNIDASGSFSVDTKTPVVSEAQAAETIALVGNDEFEPGIMDIMYPLYELDDGNDNGNDNHSRVQPKNKRTIEYVEIESSSDESIEFEECGPSIRARTEPSRAKRNAMEDNDGRPTVPAVKVGVQVKKEIMDRCRSESDLPFEDLMNW